MSGLSQKTQFQALPAPCPAPPSALSPASRAALPKPRPHHVAPPLTALSGLLFPPEQRSRLWGKAPHGWASVCPLGITANSPARILLPHVHHGQAQRAQIPYPGQDSVRMSVSSHPPVFITVHGSQKVGAAQKSIS